MRRELNEAVRRICGKLKKTKQLISEYSTTLEYLKADHSLSRGRIHVSRVWRGFVGCVLRGSRPYKDTKGPYKDR